MAPCFWPILYAYLVFHSQQIRKVVGDTTVVQTLIYRDARGNRFSPQNGNQPIKTRYLDHVTGYQPIRDSVFPDSIGSFYRIILISGSFFTSPPPRACSQNGKSLSLSQNICHTDDCGNRPKQVNNQSELVI
eukprot:sb/3474932/